MLNGRWNTTYESNTNVYFDSFRVIQGQNIYPSGTTFTPALHQALHNIQLMVVRVTLVLLVQFHSV